jgi:hypothetical protein
MYNRLQSIFLNFLLKKYAILQVKDAAVTLVMFGSKALFYAHITEQFSRGGGRGEGWSPSELAVLADGHLVRGPNGFFGGGAHIGPQRTYFT